ncbi:MAG: hypothetical protein KA296_04490 [Marinobacter sp.]|nr:hypothetical protein [Marinobacter sp.]
MTQVAHHEGIGMPSLSISKDHNASKALGSLIYTLPVTPSTSRNGLMGEPLEELADYLGVVSKRYRPSAIQALSVITYNVHRLSCLTLSDPMGLPVLGVPRRAQGFSVPSRYKVNQIGHQLWCKVVDALEAIGFLEVVLRGYKGKEHMAGLRSLYRPTQAFSIWLDQVIGRLQLEKLTDDAEPLLLVSKGPGGRRLVDYRDDQTTQLLRRQVQFISNVCQSHLVEGWIPKRLAMGKIPPALINYRRHFRDGFDQGGRLFSPLQSIPKAHRRHLRFDGMRTIELDYSSHQPRMCYHLKGLRAPEDCYAHPTIPRPLLKAAMTRIMNCGSVTQARRSIQKVLHEAWLDYSVDTGMTAGVLLETVFELHPLIKELMSNDLWMRLQYLESSIALGVMERLAKDDRPCLGIHDSFVVSEDVEDQLRLLMIEEYEKRLGYEPCLTKV